jgi:hypothetical protein
MAPIAPWNKIYGDTTIKNHISAFRLEMHNSNLKKIYIGILVENISTNSSVFIRRYASYQDFGVIIASPPAARGATADAFYNKANSLRKRGFELSIDWEKPVFSSRSVKVLTDFNHYMTNVEFDIMRDHLVELVFDGRAGQEYDAVAPVFDFKKQKQDVQWGIF